MARRGFEDLAVAFDKGKCAASAPSELDASQEQAVPHAAAEMSDASKRGASSSPLTEKLAALKGLRIDASTSSGWAAPVAPDSTTPILDTIGALSEKMDRTALKRDLHDLKNKIAQQTEVLVAEAVDPIKSDLCDLRSRASPSEQGKPHTATPSSKKIEDKSLDNLDPAHKGVAFVGWPDSPSAAGRLAQIEVLLEEYLPNWHNVDMDHFHSGLSLKKTSFVEFGSPSAAKSAATKLKDIEFKVGSPPSPSARLGAS